MANSPLTLQQIKKQSKDELLCLSDMFPEINIIERYLEEYQNSDTDANLDLLRLLIKAISEKISYYENKYGFKVHDSDQFFVEDFIDFIRVKDKYYAENGLKRTGELIADYEKGEGQWAEEAES